MTAPLQQSRFAVSGMDCASCATKIDSALRRMPGVQDVAVSVSSGTMTIKHDATSDLTAIQKKVAGLGYGIAPVGERPGRAGAPGESHNYAPGEKQGDEALPSGLHGHDHAAAAGPWWNSAKGRLTIACGFAMAAAFGIEYLRPEIGSWVFIAAMLVGLIPIGRRALMAALAGVPFTIEMLMTIAAVGAVIIGAGEEAAAVVFLFLVGELLEGVAAGKARSSIQALTTLVPKTAQLEENGSELWRKLGDDGLRKAAYRGG